VTTDADLAAAVAAETGRRLVALRGRRSVGPALGDEADRMAQEYLAGVLADARPGDAVLSEEAADDPVRLHASRVWILDPVDGTREYAQGRDDWAVHVALWEDSALVAGAVALPGRGLLLRADAPPPLPPPRPGPVRIAVSRSRAPSLAHVVADHLGGVLVRIGSAGAKVGAVVTGEVDAYVHAGGQHEWDSAAPVAVARAAGLHTSRVDGSALRYNRPDPWLPDLVVSRPELAEPILEVTARW
jgi:3'(2'), 5'-bisphosphate nucleotidase